MLRQRGVSPSLLCALRAGLPVMSIKPLPDSSVRFLASSLHIVSATALVKELLDNAIDAKANSIEIVASPNTVDQIEVRDNGTGIHEDDYDSLGRRGHTSKIRRFEELDVRASKSLGFRGEALASANSVAAVTITTRTSTDPVAAVLQLTLKTGGVYKQRPGCAPVGTTVSIRGLYSELPVREQVATKAAPKTLDSIKDLLRSYAAARPQLRLVLKVSKTPKLTWSYAPKPNAGLREAVLQLCGTAATSQCFEKLSTINANTDKQAAAMPFEFEACVPKPDADQHVLPKYQYISIDGRPMTTSRGTAKKLLSTFRKFTGNAMETGGRGRQVRDLFICLNIKCPQGSYDVNVEPSKDDVLFKDEAAFIGCFEEFCSGVYGPISTSGITEPARRGTTPNCSSDLATTRLTRSCIDTHPAEGRIAGDSKLLDNIENDCTENATESLGLGTESGQVDYSVTTGGSSSQRQKPAIQTLTGWTTASALLAQNQGAAHETPAPKLPRNGYGGNSLGSAEWTSDMAADLSERIEEPRRKQGRSRPLPAATQRESVKEIQDGRQETQLDSFLAAKPNSSATRQAEELTDIPMTPEPEVLRHYCAAPSDLGPLPLPGPKYPSVNGNEPSIMERPGRHALPSPMANSLQSGFESQRKTAPARRQAQQPWKPPSSIQKDHDEWENRYQRPRNPAGSLRQTTISFGGPGGKSRQQGPCITHDTMSRDEHRDGLSFTGLESPSDLLGPKLPTQRQNDPLPGKTNRGQDQSRRAPRSQKQKPNENHAFANLYSVDVEQHEGLVGTEPVQTSIPSGDPRAYLLRRQKSVAAEENPGRPRKLRRVKSGLLPMEHIPEHGKTHSLLLMITVIAQDVPKLIEDIERYDSYMTEKDLVEGLDMNGAELQRIETRLDGLLSLWQEELTGEKIGVESTLTKSLRNQEASQTRNG